MYEKYKSKIYLTIICSQYSAICYLLFVYLINGNIFDGSALLSRDYH